MRYLVALLSLLVFPHLAYGWGGEGHQIVALIAEDQLTPAAKGMITDLLGADIHISDAEIASWADQIRREQPATAGWHYVDIPVTETSFNEQRDGRNGANVIDKLAEQTKLLADKSTPREKRIEALKWVVHLAGDIHQPLHCAERNGDKGGNTRLVMYPGQHKAQNLHSVWDTLLVKALVAKRHVADVGDTINKEITPAQRKAWATGTTLSWGNETHRIAVEKIYADIPADGPPPTLDAAYVAKSVPIVAEQLKRGGTRLAWLLNQAAK